MPLSGYTVKPITLPSETATTFGGVCHELVQDLEGVHSRYFDNIRVWWKWYEAEPATKTKAYPWRGASNVVAPVIGTQVDARTGQDISLLWATKDKLYTGSSQNEDFSTQYKAPVMDFLNMAIEAEVKPFWTIHDAIHERNALGCSVFSVGWEEQTRYLFAPSSKKPQRVVLRRGVKWRHHPAETILWEPGIPIKESDRVVTQSLVTASDLAQMLNEEDGYNKTAIQTMLGTPHFHGSPGAEVRAEKETRAGVDPALNVSRRKVFDRRVLWLDWPMLGGLGIRGLTDLATIEEVETAEKTRVPIIVELAMDTKTILRVLPNPYLMADGNPWFDLYYRRQVGYARGVGLCKRLEGTQRAQSTIINQAIDARTLQNAMPFKTVDTKLKERPITPGQGVFVNNMQDVERFDIPNASPVDLALANLMEVWAQRAGGTSDPALGRESRSGGHPSPATNYMGQMQQASKLSSVATIIMDEQFAAAGLYTLNLYQQFDTDESGRLVRWLGASDASKVREWLFPTDMTLVGNLQLRLTALSDENPQVVMQRSLMVAQVTQAYFANILKLVQVLTMPNVPDPVKKASVQAVQVLGDVHQDFLESSSYDQAQEAILRLNEGDLSAIQQLSQLAAQAGQQPGAGPPGGGGPGGPGQPEGPAGGRPNGSVPGAPGGPQGPSPEGAVGGIS